MVWLRTDPLRYDTDLLEATIALLTAQTLLRCPDSLTQGWQGRVLLSERREPSAGASLGYVVSFQLRAGTVIEMRMCFGDGLANFVSD